MDKDSVIKALRVGLVEALNVLTYQGKIIEEARLPVDPATQHSIEQLQTLLSYSEYVYEEHPNNGCCHPLYDN